MGAQKLIVRIFRWILGRPNEQHVLAKMGNSRERVIELTDVNVHGGRGRVRVGVGNQQDIHRKVRGIGRAEDHVLVVALVHRGDLNGGGGRFRHGEVAVISLVLVGWMRVKDEAAAVDLSASSHYPYSYTMKW